MMTVTILVPVYGVEKYIAQCAESLFAQTYPNIEYVFCDDCTPDRSIEVLQSVMEKYPERKAAVRIIRQDHNSGLGGARKRLLQEVHTDTFCLVDADDTLPIDAIDILVKRMETTRKDIVEGAFRELRNDILSKPILRYKGNENTYRNRILCCNLENHCVWGKLYKSSLIELLPDMFVEGIDCSEDYCATSRILALASRTYTEGVTYHYRVDSNGTFKDTVSRKNFLSTVKACSKVLQFYRSYGRLGLAVEVGVLNVYRVRRRSDVSLYETDRLLHYVPENLSARMVCSLLRTDKYYKLGDFLYRALRTIAAR